MVVTLMMPSWMYRLHVNIDANFWQVLYHRAQNAFNPPVVNGQAYLVPMAPYWEYLSKHTTPEKVGPRTHFLFVLY
jgi:hypothetical protein